MLRLVSFRVHSMERVSRVSLEEFRARYFEPSRPAVIEGALAGWPAVTEWSLDSLATRFGDRIVSAYEMDDGRIRLDPATGFRVVHLPVREFADAVGASRASRLYLRVALPGPLGELLEDVRTPEYCKLGIALRRNLWVSAPGVVTHCHFDLPDNLLACVEGAKRFLLFAPSDGANLYRYSRFSAVPHLARVDLENPDLTRYPRLARATAFEANLRKGDLLFIPARWWHWARTEELTMSVNFWLPSALTNAVLRASDLYKRARSLNI